MTSAPRFVPLATFVERPPEEMKARAREFYEEIRRRRTVREFSPRPAPPEVIADCLRAAGTAPSGANLQPWPFVVVTGEGGRAVRHGRSLAPEQLIEPPEPGSLSRVRILDADGAFLAIGERREGRLHPHLVLVD